MRQYLERKALINLYYSLVFPYLIYCNEVRGNASAVHLEPIIKIQKRAIRTITFSSYLSPSEPIFQSLTFISSMCANANAHVECQRRNKVKGAFQSIVVPQPSLVRDYNMNMSGVDKSDQLIGIIFIQDY